MLFSRDQGSIGEKLGNIFWVLKGAHLWFVHFVFHMDGAGDNDHDNWLQELLDYNRSVTSLQYSTMQYTSVFRI